MKESVQYHFPLLSIKIWLYHPFKVLYFSSLLHKYSILKMLFKCKYVRFQVTKTLQPVGLSLYREKR
jgi:hypothetical protein